MTDYYERNLIKREGWTLGYLLFRVYLKHVMMNIAAWGVTGRYKAQESGRPEFRAPDFWFCIQPREPHPTADIFLAQKILIEQDVDELVRTGVYRYGSDDLARYYSPPKYDHLFKPSFPYTEFELPWVPELARDHSWRRFTRREEVLAYIDQALSLGEH